jgi:hypothetical protein
MATNGNTKPRARTDLAEEWVGQEVFLYDPGNGSEVHCLNSGAALIWLLCDGTRNVKRIARELSQAFQLPEPQVAAEVSQAVNHFEELNLMRS